MQTEQSNFVELPIPSEENISVGTDNVSDPVPAIRIKTKEGDADEAVNALINETLDYNPEVKCSHHEHNHEEGHACSEHGCGSHSCH